MKTFEDKLKSESFIGIVEDNSDPDKKQRIRVRVPFLHGDASQIPNDALPWAQPTRDNNGLTFSIPDKNKIVNVTYPTGNLYFPVYKEALHLNINLQNKIEELSDNDYTTFFSLCYSHNTQIFVSDSDGLYMMHKNNGINLQKNKIVNILSDVRSKYFIGNENANQSLVLGNNFFDWMDTLIGALQAPYLGNSGADVIPKPEMIDVLTQYKALKKDFISNRGFIIDNYDVKKYDAKTKGQIGDKFTHSNISNSELNIVSSDLNEPVKPKQNTRVFEEVPVSKPKDVTDLISDFEELENNNTDDENIVKNDIYIESLQEANTTDNANNDEGDFLSQYDNQDSKVEYVYVPPLYNYDVNNTSSTQFTDLSELKLDNNVTNNIVKIAKNYIGQEEVFNNNGFKNGLFHKKMVELGFALGQAWCGWFCRLVYKEAGVKYTWVSPGTQTIIKYAISNNKLTKVPKPGALALFTKYKKGESTGKGHVCIVESVNETAKTYRTIEGNTNLQGSRDGYGIASLTRRHSDDEFNKRNGLVLRGFIYPH